MQIINLTDTPSDRVIDQAVAILQAGGLIVFPTETTYGAGVDATNPDAVAKLLSYKTRREGKPLSIAVTDDAMADQYVELNDSARRLYQRFLPGPVTVISKGRGQVAPGVESEFGTLGVRIPDFPLVVEIVRRLGRPITATSANISDGKRPYQVTDILAPLSQRQQQLLDLVIDAGTLPTRPPSTVIDTTLSTPVTMRPGDVQLEGSSADQLILHSASPAETKALAGRLMLQHWNQLKDTGVVIGLDGSLGMGKTIFAKGVAEFLQIDTEITSPTYNYLEEYDYSRHGITGRLHHLDVWKVDSPALLDRLGVTDLLGPRQVIVIEWWQQVKAWLMPTLAAGHIPLIEVAFTASADSNQPDARQLQVATSLP